MVRKLWAGALAGALACTAPSWGQAPQAEAPQQAKPATAAERIITVNEAGKAPQKCRVLRCWTQKDGCRVCEVQDVATGEKITILEEAAGASARPLARIFRSDKLGTAAAPVVGEVASTAEPRPVRGGKLFGSTTRTPPVAAPAVPADPRESWGKAERWTAADSEKAAQLAAAAAERAGVSRRPVAARTADDPLLQPEKFTNVPTTIVSVPPTPAPSVKTEVVTSEDVNQPAPLPAPVIAPAKPASSGKSLLGILREGRAKTVKEGEEPVRVPLRARLGLGSVNAASARPTEREQDMPKGLGLGSVNAANSLQMNRELDVVMVPGPDGQPVVMTRDAAKGARVIAMDVTAPNAFSGPMPVRQPAMPPMHAGMPPMHMAMPPMMMPGGGAMMMAGMSMAPGYPPMTLPHPGMPAPAMVAVPVEPQVSAAQTEAAHTARLLSQLRDEQLPSVREMAADGLSRVDWKAEPAVVQALVHCAKADPAPMVRAGCVQALAKMKVNTVPVVQAVSACKQDADPRVRQAAEHALAALLAEK